MSLPGQTKSDQAKEKRGLRTAEPFYYPIAIDLNGKRVLVVGAHNLAYREVLRLLESGAYVDVIAPHMMAEMQALEETHAGRITLNRRRFSDQDAQLLEAHHYILVFAHSLEAEENLKVLLLAKSAATLAFASEMVSDSSFVTATTFKRGPLKFSVCTDGFSLPLEKALMQRIEATLVNDMDRYVLFLSSIKERINNLHLQGGSLSGQNAAEKIRALGNSEDFLMALKRQNFDEANMLFDQITSERKDRTAESQDG
jgi:precorrin-2 dehydrogenase / sirohydrochlorin ferrochelatase